MKYELDELMEKCRLNTTEHITYSLKDGVPHIQIVSSNSNTKCSVSVGAECEPLNGNFYIVNEPINLKETK